MFYGPMVGVDKQLSGALEKILATEPKYRRALNRKGLAYLFTQHSGAVLTAAALSLAVQLELVEITVERPATVVRVYFEYGNRSVAHGFNIRAEEEEVVRTGFETGNSWNHHVVMHDPDQRDSGRMLVEPLDIHCPPLNWSGPATAVVRCRVDVKGIEPERLGDLRSNIEQNPFPFLAWCSIKGSYI